MASIKNLNQKITSLENMQKVMQAMNMIATIRLRKLFTLQEPLGVFAAVLDGIARDIGASFRTSCHPAIAGYRTVRKTHIVLFTADKGLCGSHNNSVQKALDLLVEKCTDRRSEVEVTCIGSKGANYCRRREYEVFHQAPIGGRRFDAGEIRGPASDIRRRFSAGDVQEVFAVYNRFISTLHQEAVTARLLPFPSPGAVAGAGPPAPAGQAPAGSTPPAGSEAEPEPDDFLDPASERYLLFGLQAALANSLLSEQAARMTAMENATSNSQDLVNRYFIIRNRARQATITREIIEIISGKEAMKG